MIAKHVLNIHRTAGNAPERDDTDKKVLATPDCLSLGACCFRDLWGPACL